MSRLTDKIDAEVRKASKNCCGYCLLPQEILMGKLEIEHILPVSQDGTDDLENLCLACRECNSYKSSKVFGFDFESKRKIKLFNPQTQNWKRHFTFSENKTIIIGKTACGRATIEAIKMNNEQAVKARMLWVEVGWYPPEDF
jgi:hypothetical protein